MNIQPIETMYKGHRFRSRLEARWAVYFDKCGIKWAYELEGYNIGGVYYLPDFWLPDLGCFAEVKPGMFTKAEYDKCAGLPEPCILLDVTEPEAVRSYHYTYPGRQEHTEYLDEDVMGSEVRVLLEQSAAKGRMWFLLGERVDDYYVDTTAETAARSARFEHGETP